MDAEIQSLVVNGTWEAAVLPSGRKAVASKWVFDVKTNPDGSLQRYKARLVAKGFSQIQGLDYQHTFAPVTTLTTIRVLLVIAFNQGYDLHYVDIKTAFLHSELEEEIYLQKPPGIPGTSSKDVLRLKKSIYGLKQAAHDWFSTLIEALLTISDLQQSKTDSCLLVGTGSKFVAIAIYVDDILLVTEEKEDMTRICKFIADKFRLGEEGPVTSFLKVRIKATDESLKLSSYPYEEKLLAEFEMSSCNGVSTPCTPDILRSTDHGEAEFQDSKQYRSLIGSLLYLANTTRPDICFAVSKLSSFVQRPLVSHWVSAKRVLRYIKATLGKIEITFNQRAELKLEGFVDADWAGDKHDRKSQTGYVCYLAGSIISWKSKKQTCTALSTMEAEYIALCEASKEALFLRKLLQEIGYSQEEPTTIFEDNQPCIQFTNKCSSNHTRSKHIDLRYHFVKNRVEAEELKLKQVPSANNTADIFTKPLPGPKFEELRTRLFQ